MNINAIIITFIMHYCRWRNDCISGQNWILADITYTRRIKLGFIWLIRMHFANRHRKVATARKWVHQSFRLVRNNSDKSHNVMEVVHNQRSRRRSRLYSFHPGNITGFTLVVHTRSILLTWTFTSLMVRLIEHLVTVKNTCESTAVNMHK